MSFAMALYVGAVASYRNQSPSVLVILSAAKNLIAASIRQTSYVLDGHEILRFAQDDRESEGPAISVACANAERPADTL